MGRTIAAGAKLLFLAALCSCSSRASKRTLDFEGHHYLIPNQDIEAIVLDNGYTYVRLKPAGRPYLLILDTKADRQERERHRIVISGLSDFHEVTDYRQSPAGLIACRNVPYFNCGFEMWDAGVRWSLLFDQPDLGKGSSYKSDAEALLVSYRKPSPA